MILLYRQTANCNEHKHNELCRTFAVIIYPINAILYENKSPIDGQVTKSVTCKTPDYETTLKLKYMSII